MYSAFIYLACSFAVKSGFYFCEHLVNLLMIIVRDFSGIRNLGFWKLQRIEPDLLVSDLSQIHLRYESENFFLISTAKIWAKI